MPVLLDWLIEGEVIYQHWWGTGTLDDARHVNQRTLELFQQYPDRPLIHSIVNALHQEKTEVSIASARRIYTVLDHRQLGWVLMVSNNAFLIFFGNIILQLRSKIRFRIQKRLDDSIDFLKETDSNINWDNADWSVIERLEAEMNNAET